MRRVSTHHSTRDLGERCKLPQRGLGRSLGRRWILYIFQVTKKPSGTPFSVFLSDSGALKRHGAREDFSPFPPLDGHARRAEARRVHGVLGRAMPLPAAHPFHQLGGLGSAVRKLAFPSGVRGRAPETFDIYVFLDLRKCRK